LRLRVDMFEVVESIESCRLVDEKTYESWREFPDKNIDESSEGARENGTNADIRRIDVARKLFVAVDLARPAAAIDGGAGIVGGRGGSSETGADAADEAISESSYVGKGGK
ncbi:hypothetical protein HDU82_008895, partial [Entophlyctis luteolus]